MKYRPDIAAKIPKNTRCHFGAALQASELLEKLRPIANNMIKHAALKKPNDYCGMDKELYALVSKCISRIKRVRTSSWQWQNGDKYNVPLHNRLNNRFQNYIETLNEEFLRCSISIEWNRLPWMSVYGNHKTIDIDAPYSYAHQIDADLASLGNKVIGPYSDVIESEDGILTARCQYAKMDKQQHWYVHDGYLGWMPHDERIKVKALGETRDKAERFTRSAAARQLRAALR